MKSRRDPKFWKLYWALPKDIRRQAIEAYRLWRDNPTHPGLQFKKISRKLPPVWSMRIGLHWRAIGFAIPGEGKDAGEVVILWVWIGPHSEYDNLVKELQ